MIHNRFKLHSLVIVSYTQVYNRSMYIGNLREAFKKKTPDFGTLSESGRVGLKNHKLFFQNLAWTFFNKGGGFCHHVQTVKA